MRLPSDGMTPARLNGPCRTYRLGVPMKLSQLEAMPEDLQRMYLRRLRRSGATQEAAAKMLGGSPAHLQRKFLLQFDQPDAAAWEAFLNKC